MTTCARRGFSRARPTKTAWWSKPIFRTKTAVEQALLLRGHADFVDEATYETFVRDVIERKRNQPAARRLAEERPYLRPLPPAPVPNYTTCTCVVRRWITIRVGGRTYSVPSRLDRK